MVFTRAQRNRLEETGLHNLAELSSDDDSSTLSASDLYEHFFDTMDGDHEMPNDPEHEENNDDEMDEENEGEGNNGLLGNLPENIANNPQFHATVADRVLDGLLRHLPVNNNQDRERITYMDAFKSIKDFDKKIDVSDWIKYFKLGAAGLTLQQKLRLFRAKLGAECYSWYANKETDGVPRDLDDWFEELKKEFGLTPERRREAILARKQKEDEDAGDFIRDILSLCKRYNHRMLETEKVAFIRDNVHYKYRRQFNHYNVHAETVKETEKSLRGAMKFEKEKTARAVHLNSTDEPSGTSSNPRSKGKGKEGHSSDDPDNECTYQSSSKSQKGKGQPSKDKDKPQTGSSNSGNSSRGNGRGSYRQNKPQNFQSNSRGWNSNRNQQMGMQPNYQTRQQFNPQGQQYQQYNQWQPPMQQQFQPVYQQQQQQSPNYMPVSGRQQKPLTCFRCGGIGHYSFTCPTDPGMQASGSQGGMQQNRGRKRGRGGNHGHRDRSQSGNRDSGNGGGGEW